MKDGQKRLGTDVPVDITTARNSTVTKFGLRKKSLIPIGVVGHWRSNPPPPLFGEVFLRPRKSHVPPGLGNNSWFLMLFEKQAVLLHPCLLVHAEGCRAPWCVVRCPCEPRKQGMCCTRKQAHGYQNHCSKQTSAGDRIPSVHKMGNSKWSAVHGNMCACHV